MWGPTREVLLGERSIESWFDFFLLQHQGCESKHIGLKNVDMMLFQEYHYDYIYKSIDAIVIASRPKEANIDSLMTARRIDRDKAEQYYRARTDAFEYPIDECNCRWVEIHLDRRFEEDEIIKRLELIF
jgi:hypothetical protein